MHIPTSQRQRPDESVGMDGVDFPAAGTHEDQPRPASSYEANCLAAHAAGWMFLTCPGCRCAATAQPRVEKSQGGVFRIGSCGEASSGTDTKPSNM